MCDTFICSQIFLLDASPESFLNVLSFGQVEEWEKFQNDLLTSVRVANDFKTEAQQDLQRMILENKSLRERERQLKGELEKLKGKDSSEVSYDTGLS